MYFDTHLLTHSFAWKLKKSVVLYALLKLAQKLIRISKLKIRNWLFAHINHTYRERERNKEKSFKPGKNYKFNSISQLAIKFVLWFIIIIKEIFCKKLFAEPAIYFFIEEFKRIHYTFIFGVLCVQGFHSVIAIDGKLDAT